MDVNKKKIMIVHSTLHIGGAEEVTANLCNLIDRFSFDVFVCCLKERGVVSDKIELQGTPVLDLSTKKSSGTDYLTSLKLAKLIKRHEIELIHSHDVHALTDCSLCKLFLPGLKMVHTFHFGNYPERSQSFKRLERLFWRTPDRLVAVSNEQKRGIQELYGVPDDRIQTLWNGVDVDQRPGSFAVVDHYRSKGRIMIGSINTLIEQKGMFDLVEVARKLKEVIPDKFVFLVVGDGHLRESLQEKITSYQLEDYIILMGWVERAPEILLPHLDIFFQPSLWEAMSMVLLEAMAGGKPIVATRVGETPHIITDRVDGFTVVPGDIDSMVATLKNFVLDDRQRRNFGTKARQRYSQHFTAALMAQRYETLYKSLLS